MRRSKKPAYDPHTMSRRVIAYTLAPKVSPDLGMRDLRLGS
jgi:hypothetical protein